jgi:hypothetical protein
MTVFELFVENSSGTVLGAIGTASKWNHTKRLSAAGTIDWTMPAADPNGAVLESSAIRVVRCYSVQNSQRVEFGSGIVRRRAVRGADTTLRTPAGQDLLGELSHRQVGSPLVLDNGAGGATTTAAALTTVMALAPSGWTIDTTTYRSTGATHSNTTVDGVTNVSNFIVGGPIAGTGIPTGTTVTNISGTTLTISAAATATAAGVVLSGSTLYLELNNETVLAALVKIADQTDETFRATGRQVVWLYKQQPASGITVVMDGDPVALEANTAVCVVDGDPEVTTDLGATITRIYPYGAGNADARLTLASATWVPPTGYTLSAASNYIKYDAGEASPADRIDAVRTYNDIGAKAGGVAVDTVSAANQLAQKAYADLVHLIQPVTTYRLKVRKLDGALEPGQTVRFIWRSAVDGVLVVNVDATVVVMEVQTTIDTDARTAGLTVATAAHWSAQRGDVQTGARLASSTAAMSSHPQIASSALRVASSGGTAAAAIHARYTTAAGQSISSSTGVTIVDFDTLVDDTNAAVTTGAAWHFTAPIAGRYLVVACVDFVTTTTWALTERAILDVFVNGSVYSQLRRMSNLDSSGTTAIVGLMGSDTVVLAAGDTLDIRVSQNSGAALALSASGLANRVSIALL